MTTTPGQPSPSSAKVAIRLDEAGLPPYPDAVVADGLVFTSGARSTSLGGGFDAIPRQGQGKRQGFPLVDRQEGLVSASSWGAHARLEAVLGAAGCDNAQIVRQHVWQKDKRFFPVYESVRMHWQPTPAPSSGLGVHAVPGAGEHWIGLDAIAVAPGHPVFTERAVIAAVDQAELPSASHYSQAVRSGPLVFTAGHIPVMTAAPGKPVVRGFDDLPEEGRFLATGRSHPDSRDGPIAAQSWYVYKELERLLARAGLTLEDVVLSTVFLADLRDLAVFHRVHQHIFPKSRPALSIAGFDEVGHRGCAIEIELTALDPRAGLPRKAVDWAIPAPFAAPAAVQAGPFLFLSGHPGLDADGLLAVDAQGLPREARGLVSRLERLEKRRGAAAQSWSAFARLDGTLTAAGASLRDIAKITAYVADGDDLAILDAVRAEFIPTDALPAFECVVVQGPGPVAGSAVQLEVIGHV